MNKLKWIWLSEKCGAGSDDVLTLISRIGSIDAIYEADFDRYMSAGISERLADKLSDKSLDNVCSVLGWCEKNSVRVLTFDDRDFPMSLRALRNPPVVLYCAGKLPDFNRELFISVVGTRKMSEYGMKAAYKISYEIASAGAVTVSGMALGIDGVVACASIAAGGRTIAVLGCGIDVVYPAEHRRLEGFIAKNGAIITEYPPSTKPHGYNFPVRNRIISGLGVGTLVVDAPDGSGALITAKNAIIQGKDVYAVPGNIDGINTSGTNALIRDGAVAVLCGRDIIKNYAYLYGHCINMQRLLRAEQKSEFSDKNLKTMGVGIRLSVPMRKPVPNERLTMQSVSEKSASPAAIEDISSANTRDNQRHVNVSMLNENGKEANANNTYKPDKTKRNENISVKTDDRSDNSAKIFESLTERQKEIFCGMPMDKPVTVDYFISSGYAMGEVMSALTVLEIKGLVSSLPGALYIRK